MQMLLQLLDILHYCINLAISDYSSFIDVEHLISPKKQFLYTVHLPRSWYLWYTSFQLKIQWPAVFSTLLHPKKTSCFFFPMSKVYLPHVFLFFFGAISEARSECSAGHWGSFGSIFPGSEFDRIAVLIWCKMFHDVHKFQIGKSVCKFDKLKIMFYWHVGFVYSCSWSFHSILAW